MEFSVYGLLGVRSIFGSDSAIDVVAVRSLLACFFTYAAGEVGG